jgi:hypothetical protein
MATLEHVAGDVRALGVDKGRDDIAGTVELRGGFEVTEVEEALYQGAV